MKILIIEDQRADVLIEQRRIAVALPGSDVQVAGSLAEARDAVPGADMVVCDLGLPDSDGEGTIGRIAELAPRRWLVLTDDDGLAAHAASRGAMTLSKGAEAEAWTAALRRLAGL